MHACALDWPRLRWSRTYLRGRFDTSHGVEGHRYGGGLIDHIAAELGGELDNDVLAGRRTVHLVHRANDIGEPPRNDYRSP